MNNIVIYTCPVHVRSFWLKIVVVSLKNTNMVFLSTRNNNANPPLGTLVYCQEHAHVPCVLNVFAFCKIFFFTECAYALIR